jgi:hypothetical protein
MKFAQFSTLFLAGSLLLHSCVKKDFDNPPNTSSVDPKLTVNGSLSDLSLSALNLSSGKYRTMGDTTVYGIVVGDDKGGNIYKKIFIQDTTGGLQLILDKTYLYSDYPVGRKIYVKLKGLTLMNYKGTPEIVYSVNTDGTTNGIPSSLLGTYIVKANYPNTINPPQLTLFDLISNPAKYVNTLVTLKEMQFDLGSNKVVYSDPNSSTNRALINCAKTGRITMYNSNYSNFQSALTPDGNGTINGIITLYNGTPQFTLRDTTDINFTGSRCQ